MPMIHCLMEEIGEMPPQDILSNAQLKAAQQRAEAEKNAALAEFPIERGTVKRRGDGD